MLGAVYTEGYSHTYAHHARARTHTHGHTHPAQVYVRHGDRVLRDEIEIDMGVVGMSGTAIGHAVHAYAMGVCRDLGLSYSWCKDISRVVGGLVAEAAEVGLEFDIGNEC